MYINFAIYYQPEGIPVLLRQCLDPLINKWKETNKITFYFIYFDEYRGSNIRVWLKVKDENLIADIKEEAKAFVESFLEQNPTIRDKYKLPIKSLFLLYPNNSIQFFGKDLKPMHFLTKVDKLGEELTEKLSEISKKIACGETNYDPTDFQPLVIRFYLMLSYILCDKDLSQMKKFLDKTIAFLLKFYWIDQDIIEGIWKQSEEYYGAEKEQLIDEANLLLNELSENKIISGIDKEWENLIRGYLVNNYGGRPSSKHFFMVEMIRFQLAVDKTFHIQLLMTLRKVLDKRTNPTLKQMFSLAASNCEVF